MTSSVPAATPAQGLADAEEPSPRLGRLGPVLCLTHLSWMLPVAASHPLLQAVVGELGQEAKLSRYATMAAAGAVAGMVANIVFGVLSDRTRSRYGRRNPWILSAGAATAAAGCGLSFAEGFPALVALMVCFQISLNALVAPLAAVLPDRVAGPDLGKASSWVGAGQMLGAAVGGIAGGLLLTSPHQALRWIPWLALLGGLLMFCAAPDRSTVGLPREPLSVRGFARTLLPPRDADLLWALVGRLLTLLGISMVVVYQLYVLTDYMKLSTEDAGSVISVAGVINALVAGAAVIASGPLSDRLGRRKPFIVAAATLGAAAIIPMVVSPSLGAFFTLAVFASLGYGCFLAVDQAVMAEVLPDQENRAKDLGFLNVANTLPGLAAPIVAATVVPTLGYPALFLLAIGTALAGGLCILPIRRVR